MRRPALCARPRPRPVGPSCFRGAFCRHYDAIRDCYERCDGAGLPCLSSLTLSRVHLLVIESGGALWAIDTASKNGTWEGDRRIRRARLEPGRRLRLAADVTLEWCLFH